MTLVSISAAPKKPVAKKPAAKPAAKPKAGAKKAVTKVAVKKAPVKGKKSAANTPEAAQVKADRAGWRRVARRVLRSKREETRKKWAGKLNNIAGYMLTRLKAVTGGDTKKEVRKELKAQIDYVKKNVSLYRRIAKVLKGPPGKGDEALADLKIPKPGTEVKVSKKEHKEMGKVVVKKAKELKEIGFKKKAAEKSSADGPVMKNGRRILTQEEMHEKAVKTYNVRAKKAFRAAVVRFNDFERARNDYQTNPSAANKERLQEMAASYKESRQSAVEAKRLYKHIQEKGSA